MELRHYWQIILKRRRTLLWIIGVIVGTTIIASLITKPVYMFYSNVWIKTSDPKANLVGAAAELSGLGIISSDLVMYGQLAAAKNLSLTQDVISEMGLKNNKEQLYSAKEILDPGALSLLTQKIAVKINLLTSTQFLQIQGYSSSPEQAAEIANRMAANFVGLYNTTIQTAAKQAYRFIQENIPKTVARLREAEAALVEYKIANHISNTAYFREKLLTSLATLKDERDSNDRELGDSRKRVEQIRAKLKKIPEFKKSSKDYRSNPTLSYLREKLMDLESTLANTQVKVTPAHLTARQVQAQLDKLKIEYKQQVTAIFYSETISRNANYDSLLNSLALDEIGFTVRTSRQGFIKKQILNKEEELDDLTRKEVAMEPLARKVNTLQTALNNLMTQEQAARLASELNLSNAVVMERAVVPALKSHLLKYRWFPKRKLLVVFSLLFSVLLGLTTIFFQEYLDDTLPDPGETEGYLKFPVLASLPELPPFETFDLPRVMAYGPWPQAIWALPDMLKPAGQGSLSGVWGVTSTNAGEGKSLVAASLGWVLALRDLRVLLIDLNFCHPTLPSLWHLPPGEGVRELLQGTATLTDCVRQVGPGELFLLTNGKAIAAAWPQLDPKVLAHWLTTVKTGFDVLLLDLPAVGAGEGAPLAALGDQILMVVAGDLSPRTQVARALEQIQRCHGRIGGLVLNRYNKLELGTLLSPHISRLTSWPPVQRLFTFIEKQFKFRIVKKT